MHATAANVYVWSQAQDELCDWRLTFRCGDPSAGCVLHHPLNTAEGNQFRSPRGLAPFDLSFAAHRRRLRIFDLEPVRGATRVVSDPSRFETMPSRLKMELRKYR